MDPFHFVSMYLVQIFGLTLQDQQMNLTQVSFKLLLLPWILEHVRFRVHTLRVEYLFLVNFWLSQSKSNESSKPSVLGAHLTGAGPPDWGAPCGTWAHIPWGRTSETVIIFLRVGSYPGLLLLTIPYPSPSYQSHCDSFFISLAAEDVFC